MRNWSLEVARREAYRNAKIERDYLKVVPPGAVFLKPDWQPAVRKEKFFRDEDDFLSIESSLQSDDLVDDARAKNDPQSKAEKINEIRDQIEMNKLVKPKLTRSTSERHSFLEPISKLFMLSQLAEDEQDTAVPPSRQIKHSASTANFILPKIKIIKQPSNESKIKRLGGYGVQISNSARKPSYNQYQDDFIPSTIDEIESNYFRATSVSQQKGAQQ